MNSALFGLEVLAGGCLLYFIGGIVYNIFLHPLRNFPGPISHGATHLPYWWVSDSGRQIGHIKRLHEKYGPVVRYRPDALSFTTSGAWKDIYGTRYGRGQLEKDPVFYGVGNSKNKTIIYSGDADHARIRKLLAHAFSDAALREQEPILTKYFDLLIQKLGEFVDQRDGVVDLASYYNFMTFDVIGDLSYAQSFQALENGGHVWIKSVFQSISTFYRLTFMKFYEPLWTIFELLQKLKPDLHQSRYLRRQFTRERSAARLDDQTTTRKDFMTYIQRYNDKRGMTREEIIATSEVLLFAGSETTASTLAGCSYLLMTNPAVYEKVRSEIRQAFSSPEQITLESSARCEYLHAVLEESLRIYPVVTTKMPRRIGKGGDQIDGHWVPEGTSVGVHQWSAFRSPSNFTDPNDFVPERWLKDRPAKYANDDRAAFNPFSVGPRNCIGKNLAQNEMRSAMARMLWFFDMELMPQSRDWMKQRSFVLWEKPPLMVRLKRADHANN